LRRFRSWRPAKLPPRKGFTARSITEARRIGVEALDHDQVPGFYGAIPEVRHLDERGD